MKYEDVERSFSLPETRTADSISEMVRAILSQKDTIVTSLKFTASPPQLLAKMAVPKIGPPDGEVQQLEPTDIWDAFSQIELVELEHGPKSKLRLEALSVLTSMMLAASQKKLAGVGWIVGDLREFMRWLGVGVETSAPSTFWNLPLIHYSALEKDKVVLLCATSSRLSPLRAEMGVLAHIQEEKDAG